VLEPARGLKLVSVDEASAAGVEHPVTGPDMFQAKGH